jgi:hypothetical protein
MIVFLSITDSGCADAALAPSTTPTSETTLSSTLEGVFIGPLGFFLLNLQWLIGFS